MCSYLLPVDASYPLTGCDKTLFVSSLGGCLFLILLVSFIGHKHDLRWALPELWIKLHTDEYYREYKLSLQHFTGTSEKTGLKII